MEESGRGIRWILDDILIIFVLTKFVIERNLTKVVPFAVAFIAIMGLRIPHIRNFVKPLLSLAAVIAFLIDVHSSGPPEVFILIILVLILLIVLYSFMNYVFRLLGIR